jgi:UDP-N-acetylmuramate dehydrogenase
VSFADLTTIHVGGPVGRLVEATTSQELVDAVRRIKLSIIHIDAAV